MEDLPVIYLLLQMTTSLGWNKIHFIMYRIDSETQLIVIFFACLVSKRFLTLIKSTVRSAIQGNLSVVDTTGPRKCVLVAEVSLFQLEVDLHTAYWDLRNCPD